jgi:dTDP-4-dehydrorhamnose 3,5-epimerase
VRVVPQATLPEVLIVEPDVHADGRGFFVETYHASKFRELGVSVTFVQDNHSKSVRNTIRGLHLQVGSDQAKLVRVVEGEIFDVAVDVRRGSPTFGRWTAQLLSAENFKLCYLPVGFAHGFLVRSDTAQVEYKCSDFYDPSTEVGIAWNDADLAIDWSVDSPLLSERDRKNPSLAQAMDRLPVYAR